jgi:hypothetical protein
MEHAAFVPQQLHGRKHNLMSVTHTCNMHPPQMRIIFHPTAAAPAKQAAAPDSAFNVVHNTCL